MSHITHLITLQPDHFYPLMDFEELCPLMIVKNLEKKKLKWSPVYVSHFILNIMYFITPSFIYTRQGPSWSWSYGSWIYNYLCNQCLSSLTLWVQILLRQGVLDTTLNDKVCHWLTTGLWFSPGTLVSSTNKTDCHNITEILLKVALNTITLTLK